MYAFVGLSWAWILVGFCTHMTAQECNQAFVSGFSDYTTSSVKIKWIDFSNQNPEGYEIELGPKGFSREGIATTPIISTTQYDFNGLEPSTSYDFWLRVVCDSMSQSEWNGPFTFNTNLTNPTECGIQLGIDNNNCPTNNIYRIAIEDLEDAQLGVNYTLDKINLIIDHPWPADLAIALRSPSGKSVSLVKHRGIGSINYGSLGDDALCTNPVSFSADACERIDAADPPFIGSFKPEGNLNDFLDGSSVNGIWHLEICDRAEGDIGILKYARLIFTEESCPLPFLSIINDINSDRVTLRWEQAINCDGLELEIGPLGFIPGTQTTTFINCDLLEFVIEDLEPDTQYEYYIRSVCGPNTSAYSCPFVFNTSCERISTQSSFDAENLCPTNCNQNCLLEGIWKNTIEDDHDWIVSKDATPSSFTGPSGDLYSYGHYIYIENISEVCAPGTQAILESTCIQVKVNELACGDMQFAYHMYGLDITQLSLDITSDDGTSWSTIWHTSGEQGNQWNIASIDLSDYNDRLVRFRFRALSGDNAFGDIALDQIDFFGSIVSPLLSYYFDEDGDGYGRSDSLLYRCSDIALDQFVRNEADCDDSNAFINPAMTEIPCNLIDENCNGDADDPIEINPILYTLVQKVDESCAGSQDGLIQLDISGGQEPYQIRWNNNGTGALLNNVSEGVYFAEISDANGCLTRTSFIEIEALFNLSVFLTSSKNPSCLGIDDGSIQVAASGGIEPYRFIWQDGIENQLRENLAPGTYHLFVEDATGCQSKALHYDIIADPELVAGANITNVRCYAESNGRIQINVNDGAAPYRYTWSTGAQSSEITQLIAGSYACTITDLNGCYIELNDIVVAEPIQAQIVLDNIQQVSCPRDRDGSIEISVRGGSPPYTYLWSNNNLTDDLFGLTAGYYSVTATDSKACTVLRDSILISEPDPIEITIDSITMVRCPLSTDGYIEVSVRGGSGDYFYFWSIPESKDSTVLDSIGAGTYSLTVIDEFDCKHIESSIHVDLINGPIELQLSVLSQNICPQDSMGSIAVEARQGNFPIAYNWSSGTQNVTSSYHDTIYNLSSGIFQVTATDHTGCLGVSSFATIPEAAMYEYALTEVVNNDCAYDSLGSIRLNIIGGNPPFQVHWNNAMQGAAITQLPNGSYIASITDAENCELITQNIQIQSPDPLTVQVEKDNQSEGQVNGRIELFIEGGIGAYTIIWEDYSQWNNLVLLENLEVGSYEYTIRDANGCILNGRIDIDLVNAIDGIDPSKIEYIIYPNPASQLLYITFYQPMTPQDLQIRLLDVSGSQVSLPDSETSQINENSTIHLSVGHLPRGIYIVQLQSRDIIDTKIIYIEH